MSEREEMEQDLIEGINEHICCEWCQDKNPVTPDAVQPVVTFLISRGWSKPSASTLEEPLWKCPDLFVEATDDMVRVEDVEQVVKKRLDQAHTDDQILDDIRALSASKPERDK